MSINIFTNFDKVYSGSEEIQKRFFALRKNLVIAMSALVIPVGIITFLLWMFHFKAVNSSIISLIMALMSTGCIILALNNKVKVASYIFVSTTELLFFILLFSYLGSERFPFVLLSVVGILITANIVTALLIGGLESVAFSLIVAVVMLYIIQKADIPLLTERIPSVFATLVLSTVFTVYASYMQGWLYRRLAERSKKVEDQNVRLEALLHDLEEQKLAAEKATRYKSEFMARMSHELRTPLHSVIGIADLLRFGSYELNEEILAELEQEQGEDFDKPIVTTQREIFQHIAEDGNFKSFLVQKVAGFYKDDYEAADKDRKLASREKMLEIIDKEERQFFEAYKNIKDSGDYLLSLINGILNVSRIESGNIEINKSVTDINEFCQAVMHNIINYTKSKGKSDVVELKLEIAESATGSFIFDKLKIRQVLLNLLSNAVKFTESGYVKLRVWSAINELCFRVEDSGCGIREEDKEKVFSEFVRFAESENIEGTGLGLSLSKAIVEKHGGRIGFDSEFGDGSKFFLCLPAQKKS